MRKQAKQNAHATRIQRAAAKKARKDAAQIEFEAGYRQANKRADTARRRRRAINFADNLALLALVARGDRR